MHQDKVVGATLLSIFHHIYNFRLEIPIIWKDLIRMDIAAENQARQDAVEKKSQH